jgi:hypothetical protein
VAEGVSRPPRVARHELPLIDERALAAARAGDRLVAAAEERGNLRWSRELGAIPGLLRDGDLADVRRAAARARSAYGPKDSVRDALPPEATEPFLEAIDRLIRELARYDRNR